MEQKQKKGELDALEQRDKGIRRANRSRAIIDRCGRALGDRHGSKSIVRSKEDSRKRGKEFVVLGVANDG